MKQQPAPIRAAVALWLILSAIALVACDDAISLTLPTPTAVDSGPAVAAAPATPTAIAAATVAPAAPALAARPDVPNALGRVIIPRLGLDAPVVAVSWELAEIDGQPVGVWPVPENAIGYHRDSVAPGQPGNCVLSGHSSAQHGGVLNGLWDLQRGDEIRVTIGEDQAIYYVRTVDTLPELGRSLAQRRQHAQAMAPTDDARLTLITCWPEWAYTHRVIVVAHPEPLQAR